MKHPGLGRAMNKPITIAGVKISKQSGKGSLLNSRQTQV